MLFRSVTFSNTISVANVTTLTGGLVVASGALANVVSNANVGNNLAVGNNITVANTLLLTANSALNSGYFFFNNSTTQTIVDQFPVSTYRSAEYLIQMSDTSTAFSQYHITKILLIHDGTNPYLTEYGTIYSNNNLGSIDAVINTGNVQIKITPNTSFSNVAVKLIRTAITPGP